MNALTNLAPLTLLTDYSLTRAAMPGAIPYAPVKEVLAAWRKQIADAKCADVRARIGSFHMSAEHGGLTRDGQRFVAYTNTGMRHLLSFMQPAAPNERHPNNLANCVRFLSPAPRAGAFADLMDRAGNPNAEVIFRTAIDKVTGARALRAVVSLRHSLEHGDDAVLIAALEEFTAGVGAESWVRRDWDFTHGSIKLPGTGSEVTSGVSFRNSETRAASLEIRSSVIFSFGAQVTLNQKTIRSTNLVAAMRTSRVRHVGAGRVSNQIMGAVESSVLDGGRVADLWARAKATKLDADQLRARGNELAAEGVDVERMMKIEVVGVEEGTLASLIAKVALYASAEPTEARWDLEAVAGALFAFAV